MARKKVLVISLSMILLSLAVGLLGGMLRKPDYDVGDWSGADAGAMEAQYKKSDDPQDLAALLKALSWRWTQAGDDSCVEPLRRYGQELLDMARDGRVDLEQMDEDGILLKVLTIIREAGAH